MSPGFDVRASTCSTNDVNTSALTGPSTVVEQLSPFISSAPMSVVVFQCPVQDVRDEAFADGCVSFSPKSDQYPTENRSAIPCLRYEFGESALLCWHAIP